MRPRHLLRLLVVCLGAAGAASAQPPAELRWTLVQAEIRVRPSLDGRYVVESFLDLAPPRSAHPDFDPGGLDFWFHGDPQRQRLEVVTGIVNGREVERVVGLEPSGRATRVLLRIEEPLRTAPLSVHLVALLGAHRGRVAIPVSTPNEGAKVTVHRPDGSVDRPERLPRSVVVNRKEAAGQGFPLFSVVVAVCFASTVIFTIVILRRRARA